MNQPEKVTNKCVAEGVVTWAYRAAKIFKGTIEVPDGEYKNKVPFVAFGRTKEAMEQQVTQGSTIRIVGKVNQSSYKKQGSEEWIKDCSVKVDEYRVIADAPEDYNPPQSNKYQSNDNPPISGAPVIDFDDEPDIPF